MRHFSIYFPKDKNAEYSPGKTRFIDEKDNNIFEHSFNGDKGSSGCPILLKNNENNNDVIGINLGYNKGLFIQQITREFYKEERIKKYNEIKKEVIKNVINTTDDEITITYKICYEGPNVFYRGDIIFNKFGEKSSKYKLFGEKFVERNKNFCKIIIKGKDMN